MNYEQRISALEKAVFQAQPLPKLTDEHSPEVVRPQWEAIPEEEKKAGWWRLDGLTSARHWIAITYADDGRPSWTGDQYRIVKTEKHPDNDRHARVKLEWGKVKDKGTHEIWAKDGSDSSLTWFNTRGRPCWVEHLDYEIRPIAKKKIDKSKLPIGAMTNYGKLFAYSTGRTRAYFSRTRAYFIGQDYPDKSSGAIDLSAVHIRPMTQWEVLQDGDVIPDGLAHEMSFGHTPAHPTCFRITGIADGWTDE